MLKIAKLSCNVSLYWWDTVFYVHTYEDYGLFTTLEQYVGILAHCQNQKTAIRFRFFAKDRIKAFKKVTR